MNSFSNILIATCGANVLKFATADDVLFDRFLTAEKQKIGNNPLMRSIESVVSFEKSEKKSLLGSGRTGKVYRGSYRRDDENTPCAVKVIKLEGQTPEKLTEITNELEVRKTK